MASNSPALLRSKSNKNNITNSNTSLTKDFLSSELGSLKVYFESHLKNLKEEIIERLQEENNLLKVEMSHLKDNLNEKTQLIIDMEKDIIDVQQYIRRNNIEIMGIPSTVKDNDLEKKVVEIAASIDVSITTEDIEACHRLKDRKNSKEKRTIVRFVNRKICDKLHQNKKKIKSDSVKGKLNELDIDNSIFINNNLCPYNKYLWGKCKQLYKDEMIDRFWIFNGHLHIAFEEGENGKKINHFETLREMFPVYNFDKKLQQGTST